MSTTSAASRRPRKPAAKNSSAKTAVEPDLKRALNLVMELMAIPGGSGREGKVAEFITQQLRKAGASADMLHMEPPPANSPLKGEIGSLILKFPGTQRAPRRLLMAHLDTVPICIGSVPKLKGNFVRSANPATGLGADDRAGVAVVLSAALEILERHLPHPLLTFFWTVQEEIGLYGARHARLGALGRPKLAFNWDGSAHNKLNMGATGAYRIDIEIEGLAAHAGNCPERGVSAIAIAGLAIADLVRDGWHGQIKKGRRTGTSNVGVISGGEATNVVTDRLLVRAEARSHDPKFRKTIVKAIEDAFRRAAHTIRSDTGKTGRVRLDGRLDYESFRLADDEPCVLAAEAAVRSIGAEPYRAISNGGQDANWMVAHGLPTVTLGCGQMNVHTQAEQLDVPAFQRACRIALRLATGTESQTP